MSSDSEYTFKVKHLCLNNEPYGYQMLFPFDLEVLNKLHEWEKDSDDYVDSNEINHSWKCPMIEINSINDFEDGDEIKTIIKKVKRHTELHWGHFHYCNVIDYISYKNYIKRHDGKGECHDVTITLKNHPEYLEINLAFEN